MSKVFFTSYSLDPLMLTQFITPFRHLGMPQFINMEYWAYVGIAPLCLALSAVLFKRDVRTRLLLIFAVLTLLLALGGSTPIYEWLYDVPLFNRFRVPARFLLLWTFAIAILAAIGLDALRNRARVSNHHSKIWIGAIAVGGVILFGIQLHLANERPVEDWLALWEWLPFVLGVTTLIVVGAVRFLPREEWVTAILILTLFDLITFSAPFRFTLTRMSLPSDWTQVSRAVQAMDTRNSLYRSYYIKPPMTGAAIRGILFTNLPLLYNKQGLNNYLPSLAIRRNQKYIDEMSSGMRNLIGMRYYLLPLDTPPFGDPLPPWWDEFEPDGGLTPELLAAQHKIPPIRVSQIEITSYTDQTLTLPDGQLVGELILGSETDQKITLPIRLGIETADWAYDVMSNPAHTKPSPTLTFPAYLKSIGRTFEGRKYLAHYQLAREGGPLVITSVGARSFLPVGGLNIERVILIDDTGRSYSLAALWYRNDLALVFRSHAVAMWENHDALPRAFIVHRAEIVNGDDALEHLKAPDFPYRQMVLLSDAPMAARFTEETGNTNDQVAIIEYKPERVVINVSTDQTGYLVLTDSWYPGWSARVDGRETPIYRADYIFRAVPLLSGQHTVVFEYQPHSLRWGAIVSGFSVLLGGLIAFYAWRRC